MPNVGDNMEHLGHLYIAGSNVTGRCTLENSLAVSTKGKNMSILWPSNSTSGKYPRKISALVLPVYKNNDSYK